MSDLWLIRHGETEWSKSQRHTGRTDVPLTPLGELQAETLRVRLRSQAFALVLTSPLQRARATCRLAGFGDQSIVDADLSERDYGIFEGRTTPDIRREIPDWDVWSAEVIGGETLEQVGVRADRAVARLLATPGNSAIFAHAHLLRILASRWLGLGPESGRIFALDTASISVLGYERERRVMRLWNDVSHLQSEPGMPG